jgi:vacuolar-type H+-ATPase subunit H
METVIREFRLPINWTFKRKELYNKPDILAELLSLSELLYDTFSTNKTIKESIDDQITNMNSIITSLRDIINTKDNEIKHIIATKDNEIVTNKQRYELLIKTNQELYNKTIDTQIATAIETRTKSLLEAIDLKDRLISKLEQDINNRVSETKHSYEQRILDNKEVLNNTITRITNLEHTINSLRIENDTLKANRYKNELNSSIKGSKGEQDCIAIIKSEFYKYFEQGNIDIDKTSKEKGEGDIIVSMKLNKHGYHKEPITILIEAKNYSKEVPREETEKFVRDTEFNSDKVDGAILVSLNTRISNHPDIYFDTIGDKHVPIFMISKFNDEGMYSMFIPCILSMLSVSKSVRNLYNQDIERMRTELNRTLSSIIRQRNLITNSIKNLRKAIDELTDCKEIATNLIGMIEEFHNSKRLHMSGIDNDIHTDKDAYKLDDLFITWLMDNTMKVEDVNERICVSEMLYIVRNGTDIPIGLDILNNEDITLIMNKDSELKLSLSYVKGYEIALSGFIWLSDECKRLAYEARKYKKHKPKAVS